MSERGFVITDNLRESDNASKDTQIIDNLGGAGTAGNFQLFSGNLRRESVLIQNESFTWASETNTYSTDVDNGFIAFSNGTRLNLRAQDGEVLASGTALNSDGIQTFQIVDSNGDPIPFPVGYETGVPTPVELVRSDAITSSNIANLKRVRLETVADSGDEGNFLATEGSGEQNIFGELAINTQYSTIDAALSVYYFKLSRLPLSYEDSSFTRDVNLDGYIRIVNDNLEPRTNSSPGLFIVQDGVPARAFEGRDNPWTESTGALVTTANSAVNTITLTNPTIASISTSANSGPVTNASHKLPVDVIDGNGNLETYFLLLDEII